MYVCGPTVYDAPHIGHGRLALVFDVLRRYLLFTGLAVTFVSNVTDIDDKIIERAAERGIDRGRAGRSIRDGRGGRASMRWASSAPMRRPTPPPMSTDMVELIAELMDRGVAYEAADGVYLSVIDVPGYGLLARQPLDSLRAGARVEIGRGQAVPRSTSRCGRRPSPASRPGNHPGAPGGRAGTPSAW